MFKLDDDSDYEPPSQQPGAESHESPQPADQQDQSPGQDDYEQDDFE